MLLFPTANPITLGKRGKNKTEIPLLKEQPFKQTEVGVKGPGGHYLHKL